MSDGENSLLDIAARANLPWVTIKEALGALCKAGLLKPVRSDAVVLHISLPGHPTRSTAVLQSSLPQAFLLVAKERGQKIADDAARAVLDFDGYRHSG